jgi:hypothetical protein
MGLILQEKPMSHHIHAMPTPHAHGVSDLKHPARSACSSWSRLLFLPAVAWIALGSSPATAVELAAIERTIHKEPTYQSGAPKYCLVVFGAKADTHVWLVLDVVSALTDADGSKNSLYVDRNGNGDLTEPGERVTCSMIKSSFPMTFLSGFPQDTEPLYNPQFKVGPIIERDGKTKHTDLTVDMDSYLQEYRPCLLSLKVNGRVEQSAGGQLLRFSDRPQNAPIIHFNGPLSLQVSMNSGSLHVPFCYDEEVRKDAQRLRNWYDERPPYYEKTKLVRGESRPAHNESTSLTAHIGTPGLGLGTFAKISADIVPEDVHPVAIIEFPTWDQGKPPIISPVVLTQRYGTSFMDTVLVPEEAAPGKAKVSLSMPNWRGIPVAPTEDHVLVGGE